MGYTHYWTQTRDFTRDEWVQIREDFEALLKDVQHVQGIPLANGEGEPGTSPEILDKRIFFNGAGDDAHETFCLYRVRPPKEEWEPCPAGISARRPGSPTTWPSPRHSATSRPSPIRYLTA
jgi:hypothetical protein